MKKIVIVFCLIMLLTTASFSEVTANQNSKIDHITKKLSDIAIQMKTEKSYTTFEIPNNYDYYQKPGFPKLPIYSDTHYFPNDAVIHDITINVQSVQTKHIAQNVQVNPEPILASSKTESSDTMKRYNPDTTYPATWATWNIGHGIIRNELKKIVTITYFPMRYTESKGIIETTDDISVDIRYTTQEEQIQSLSNEESYDFIIITAEEFKDELQPLRTHKINRNISTKIVSLTSVYNGIYFPSLGRDNPEKIKYFIKHAIEEWNTKNVMLVGGSDAFPVRATHVYISDQSPEPEVFVSDLYYADIYNSTGGFASWDTNENNVFGEYRWNGNTDEVDLYPDVHLGRIACINEEEVNTVVNKIINYENNEAYKQNWFSNLILVGGDTFPGEDEGVSEGEFVNDKIHDVMDGFIPKKLYASNGQLSVNAYITNAIEEGGGFVSFAGHGNPISWSTHPFENGNLWIPAGGFKSRTAMSLQNADKLPIVAISACSVAKFNANDETLCWSFVSNPNGGGIASFGTTALGYGSYGSAVTRSNTGKMIIDTFRAYRDDGAITVGEMWSRSLNRYLSPYLDKYDHKTIEEWILFGDPTLAIAEDSEPPLIPELSGPATGAIDKEHTYSAITTDPEDDDVYYMFDWGDGTYSDWIGPYDSGRTIDATHRWSERGNYEIRVKAKDDHGVMGDWSDPLPVSMPNSNDIVSNWFSVWMDWISLLFPFSFLT